METKYIKPPSCASCPLHDAPGPVWGEGLPDAQIMLVGEGPGEDEALMLRPFVGGSGKVLSVLLRHAQIDRRQCYVTNIVRCRPTVRGAGGQLVNRQPTETEIRCCGKFMVGELESVKPNVVVALGNVPLHTLTAKTKGILTLRSVPIEGPKRRDGQADRYKVVATLHPAAVMRQSDYWPAVVFDLARAQTESAFPGIVRRPWTRVIHAHLADVGESLRRRILSVGHYSHDLETTGLDPSTSAIRCIGIAAEADEVFCFDWTHDVQQFVSELHANPLLTTVGQNSEGFDIPFQEYKGFRFNGPSYDTMLGWHLLNSGLPKDLGFIGATVTDEPYWKDESMYRSGEDALQVGCAKDVHATARAFEEQHKELDALGQRDLYYKHIMPLQPVLRSMTKRGLRKNLRAAGSWSLVLNRKADEIEVKLKKGLGDPTLNVNSPKQLMDLLYRRMGLPVQYRKDREHGMHPSVDVDALDALVSISKNPILMLIYSVRTLRKWDATFIRCPHDDKGYVHGHFSSAKAANGRLNCTDPNMQNFPLEAREIFVPDSEDHVLLASDWSQIEWRVAMTLSGDANGLDALAAGRDAHKDAYAKAYNKDYDSITKKERFQAKFINYGLLYGRGEDSLANPKKSMAGGRGRVEDARIPIEHVRDYMQKFLSTFSAYDRFRKTIEQHVRHDHYVSSPWGRRRWWYTTSQMPEAYNFPISSAAASMMYEILVELEAQLPKGSTLRLTVHDEVVINAPKDQKILQQTIECVHDIMTRPFPQLTEASLYPDMVRHYYPNGWFCPSDMHIAMNWRQCKCDTKEDEVAERQLLKHLGVTTK
jgi:uracil-DNA glycosylase family 4